MRAWNLSSLGDTERTWCVATTSSLHEQSEEWYSRWNNSLILSILHHRVFLGDLSTMRRATEKVDTEVTKLEADKKLQVSCVRWHAGRVRLCWWLQDLFVDRLVQQVDTLREQISMYEYQLKVQSMSKNCCLNDWFIRSSLVEETKNIKHTLTEARLESETLELEKKQLMQNWNSCLIGIRRRDEAQATMGEAVRYLPDDQRWSITSVCCVDYNCNASTRWTRKWNPTSVRLSKNKSWTRS